MKRLLAALERSFELHEEYRELLRKARAKSMEAREADEQLRQLRKIERERARERGRAA